MRALTVRPGEANSLALTEMDEPHPDEGSVLVDAICVGLCGTDFEIIAAEYGQAPPGSDVLVLGHENLGRVMEAPMASGFTPGDLVVGIVRRPDPVPCAACAVGEWDMCRNGRYTEHGIQELHGFARERWRANPDALVKINPALGDLGVLLEPASVLAKAWEQVERVGKRSFWEPAVAVITGAGPIGLLAALMSVQRGLETHVIDRATDGPKPELVRGIGAVYHADPLPRTGVLADVLIECTGAPQVVLDAIEHTPNNSVVCLTGVSPVGNEITVDVGGLSRNAVLRNHLVFGTVNANRGHYEAGAEALAKADPLWLAKLISRRVPLSAYQSAFDRQPDDVKVVLDI